MSRTVDSEARQTVAIGGDAATKESDNPKSPAGKGKKQVQKRKKKKKDC